MSAYNLPNPHRVLKSPADLARLVRPYVQTPPKPDRRRTYFNGDTGTDGTNLNTDGDEVPTLEWFALAKVETTTIKALNLTFEWENDEEEREVEVQRIFSDADPEAYIDVEVMKSVLFKTKSGEKLKLNFSNPT